MVIGEGRDCQREALGVHTIQKTWFFCHGNGKLGVYERLSRIIIVRISSYFCAAKTNLSAVLSAMVLMKLSCTVIRW